jgi:hypothetical protein
MKTYEQQLDELEEAVRNHALANYTTGGWDILVEATTEDELIEIIRGARSEAGAIRKAAAHFGVVDAVRADIVSA